MTNPADDATPIARTAKEICETIMRHLQGDTAADDARREAEREARVEAEVEKLAREGKTPPRKR